MAAPAILGVASTASRAGAGTFNLFPPIQADLSSSFIVVLVTNGLDVEPPSGFTQVRFDDGDADVRIYQGTGSAGPTWTFTAQGAVPVGLQVAAAVMTTYDRAVTINGLSMASGEPTISPSVGGAPADSLTFYAATDANDSTAALTYPTNATLGRGQRVQPEAGSTWSASVGVAHKAQGTAGETGMGAWTIPAPYQPKMYTAYLTAAPTIPAPTTGAVVSVMAHQDDYAFIETNALEDHDAGAPYVGVYVTAGDNNAGWGTGAQNREAGAKAAAAAMVGASSPTWLDGTVTLAGKTVSFSHLYGHDTWLYWLRLPDTGNGTPLNNTYQLWAGGVSTLFAVTGGVTYTKAQLTSVLAAIIDRHAAAKVMHLNHRADGQDGDHPDHAATARFARAAVEASTTKPPAEAYLGEQLNSLPTNLDTTQKNRKQSGDVAYGSHTGDTIDAGWEPYWWRSYLIDEPNPLIVPAATATMFGAAAPTGLTPSTGTGPATAAVGFRVAAGGTSKVVSLGARFFLPAGTDSAAEGTGYFATLWKASSYGVIDEWVASGMFGSVVRNAWQTCNWLHPVELEPGATYYISVTYPRGRRPAASGFFTSGSQTSPTDSRISAPATGTVRQGMYRGGDAPDRGFAPDAYDAAAPWFGIDGTFGFVDTQSVTAQFSGSGTLTAFASKLESQARAAAFSGSGRLSAVVDVVGGTVARSAPFSGAGALTATARVRYVVEAPFAAVGSLTAVADRTTGVARVTTTVIGPGGVEIPVDIFIVFGGVARGPVELLYPT